ncbi:MAG TPA: molybdenum cofactor biosynthesis protein MoaE [Gemmatimonadales bacterium]
MPYCTTSVIDLAALIDAVAGPECGGIATFVGTVRCGEDDGPVRHIEYSGYEEMIEAEFAGIAAEARARWPRTRTAARHRIGIVLLGEASIAVVVAAPHRAEALDACRFMIEEAKRRLPVWKKEVLQGGEAVWRDNTGRRVPSGGGPRDPD